MTMSKFLIPTVVRSVADRLENAVDFSRSSSACEKLALFDISIFVHNFSHVQTRFPFANPL